MNIRNYITLINAILILVMFFVFLTVGPAVERWLLPVKTDFKVLEYRVEGDDVYLTTSAIKHRSCNYIPPNRARTDTGVNLQVITVGAGSDSTWLNDDQPQVSREWRVVGGAGNKITFYQEFECHPLWHTFAPLGSLDVR